MKRLRPLYLFVFALILVGLVSAAPPPPEPAAPAATGEPAVARRDPQALLKMADEVAQDVTAIRGWAFKEPVKKSACTPAEACAEMAKEIDEQYPDVRLGQVQAFLRMVGLLPPECDLKQTYLALLEEQAGGFYNPRTKTLYLVDRDGADAPTVDRIFLAHELTHALDDQQVDFGKTLRPLARESEDMDLVVGSVLEGSATALMMQYMDRLAESGRLDMGELMQYAQRESVHNQAFQKAPRYFWSVLGAYLCGMRLVCKGDLAVMMAPDGGVAVGKNFLVLAEGPPRSTEQVLHPQKYWDPAQRDEPVLVDDDAMAKILARPKRWVVHKDTVGEMLLAILATPKESPRDILAMQSPGDWTNPAARGWGGDRFYLLASGKDEKEAGKSLKDLAGLWITLWDTSEDRGEFVAALEKAPSPGPRVIVRLGGLGAAVFFGFDETEWKAIARRLEESPPPMRRGDTPWTFRAP